MLHNQSWHCQINYRLTSRDGTLVFLWSDSTISTTTSWDKASAQIATFFIYAWQVARCRNPKHIWFFTKLLSSSNTQGPINIQYRTLMMTSKPSNCQKFTCVLERVFPIYIYVIFNSSTSYSWFHLWEERASKNELAFSWWMVFRFSLLCGGQPTIYLAMLTS